MSKNPPSKQKRQKKYWDGRKEKGEVRGSGIIIIRRGQGAGLVKGADRPFEHPNVAAAMIEAHRLSTVHPGQTFEIMVRSHAYQDGRAFMPLGGVYEGDRDVEG